MPFKKKSLSEIIFFFLCLSVDDAFFNLFSDDTTKEIFYNFENQATMRKMLWKSVKKTKEKFLQAISGD